MSLEADPESDKGNRRLHPTSSTCLCQYGGPEIPRDEEVLQPRKDRPHSLGRWRVNGTLRNLEQFFDAFLYTPLGGRCHVARSVRACDYLVILLQKLFPDG